MMRHTHWMALVAVVVTPLACAGEEGPDESHAYTGAKLSDYAASWDGYAEAWQFESGSDRVRLVLNGSGQGTLELGDVAALPPPTDPDVAYPPGYQYDLYGGQVRPTEGFAYPVYDTHVEQKRIQLGADPNDLVRDWCQMQTPIVDEVNTVEPIYACVPNWGFETGDGQCSQTNPETQEKVPVDCGKLALCDPGGSCVCTASGCDAWVPNGSYAIELDGALEDGGDTLVGTLVLEGERITVRLQRN